MSSKYNVQLLPGARSEIVIKAAYRMARVFVRMFSPYLSTAVLADLVTQAGVEFNEAQCKKENPKSKVTLSKLSLMTGVPTTVIKEIQQKPKAIADYHVCAEAAILARWAKDPGLRSPVSNEPADLPIFGVDGSFQSLVNRHAGRGISTRTALDRLVASGNVEVVGKHFARMVDPNWRFIEDNEDEFLDYGTRAIASLGMTVCHNLKERKHPENKYVERRVYSVCIPRKKLKKIEREVNELLMRQKVEFAEYIRQQEVETQEDDMVVLGAGYYQWQGCCEDPDYETNRWVN